MRKTNVVKTLGIALILFIISLAYSNKVQASEASLSVSTTEGSKDFTVTVNIPSDIAGYDGNVSITYSNGTNTVLASMTPAPKLDDDNNFTYIGNYSKKFTASQTGQAVVTISNFKMYSIDNSNANNLSPVNSVTTLSQTITITDQVATPAPAPTQNPTPTTTPEPTTPNGNNQPATPAPAPVKLNFKENNEKMYTNRRVNVRGNYGTDSSIIQTLAVGTEVIRTGISDGNKDGYSWSRISYNGITGYVITAALTNQAPAQTPAPNPTEEPPQEQLEEPKEENPEETPEETPIENGEITAQTIAEELGSIPEVGVNIMPFMFVGCCTACIVLMIETKRRLAR